MNMNKYLQEVNQAPVLALTLVIAAGVGFSAGNLGDSGNGMDSGLEWSNQITIEKNGQQIDQFHNTLTDQGENYIAGKLFNETGLDSGSVPTTPNKFAWIGVGNGSDVTSGISSLDKEINAGENNGNISRELAETLKYSNPTYTLKKTFKANMSGGDIKVNTTGLFFNSTGPSLVSGGNFTSATLKDGDEMTVTHEITISGS